MLVISRNLENSVKTDLNNFLTTFNQKTNPIVINEPAPQFNYNRHHYNNGFISSENLNNTENIQNSRPIFNRMINIEVKILYFKILYKLIKNLLLRIF